MGIWRGRSRDPLAACVETCSGYLAGLGDTSGDTSGAARRGAAVSDAARLRLAAALGTLLSTRTFDALLPAGDAALRAGGPREADLALRLAGTALEMRDKSKGGWRLRARALEALERPVEAAEAYERYLGLSQGPAAEEVALHMRTLREKRACLTEAAGLFPPDGPQPRGGPQQQGGPQEQSGCPHARAFAAAVHGEQQPATEIKAAFTAHLGARMRERGAGDPEVRRLARLYATYCRLVVQPRMADPLLGGTEPCGLGGLRALVAGRRVCVVANIAPSEGDSALAAAVDAYDLVVRCDRYRTSRAPGEPGTGMRTDVHAVGALADGTTPRWHEPVSLRLVFAESADDWRGALRRLVPGAQHYAGDAALRHPIADPALIGESGWGARPTTGFTMARLLDFLDVSPAIDLIGYGPPGRLREKESEWVTAHATSADGVRTSLR
ncbi:hypothetical protein LHJ74_27980 [Streptomyces sp. N2-109]|uniref:Uncharacterized protein n=1 Tax=Streptomyces gossypii TaxID=2883101 RepID=A0ABT2K0J7_9ACTN|nr:hypothetical protein [Streptomyces gossypii]MCT2592966.1 hypothetical protein [Streptomyces gossypii]MCT2593699.1 hypothetical protein [Streptomyces gossypii]